MVSWPDPRDERSPANTVASGPPDLNVTPKWVRDILAVLVSAMFAAVAAVVVGGCAALIVVFFRWALR